jgi:hypothetical protein
MTKHTADGLNRKNPTSFGDHESQISTECGQAIALVGDDHVAQPLGLMPACKPWQIPP